MIEIKYLRSLVCPLSITHYSPVQINMMLYIDFYLAKKDGSSIYKYLLIIFITLCDDSEILYINREPSFRRCFRDNGSCGRCWGTVHLVLFSRLVSSVRVTKATKKNQFAFVRCPCASILHRCSRLDSVFIFASCDC